MLSLIFLLLLNTNALNDTGPNSSNIEFPIIPKLSTLIGSRENGYPHIYFIINRFLFRFMFYVIRDRRAEYFILLVFFTTECCYFCVFLLCVLRWSTALDVSARGMHSQCIQSKASICDGYKIEWFTI